MKPILTAAQTRAADTRTIEGGFPSLLLMERAAMAVVTALREESFDLSHPVILAGTGNNGGDGVAVARILSDLGYKPQVLALGDPTRYSTERRQQEEFLPDTVPVLHRWEDLQTETVSLYVDALFGIGLTRPIEGICRTVIETVTEQKKPIVAVDMPSGIHTDTGAVLGAALPAMLTVTFGTAKPGQLLYPGRAYTGRCRVEAIGNLRQNDDETPPLWRVEEADIATLPARDESGNKGTFGKTLVVAGSAQICGAAYLSAKAALRSGIGMVKIYTEKSNRVPLAASFPEALLETFSEGEQEEENLREAMDWADAILVGPGIGCGADAEAHLQYILEHAARPLILDADALNLLAKDPERCRHYEGTLILTPHVREMERLLQKSTAEIKADPVEMARKAAAHWRATVVLKDAATVIAEPDGTAYLYADGNSALSTAGSGDVLAGLIAGLVTRYRGRDLPLAALGVCIHGACGQQMAEEQSEATVLAGDLLAAFSRYL